MTLTYLTLPYLTISNDTPDPSVTQTEVTVKSGENSTDGAVVASLAPPKRKFPVVMPYIRRVAEQLRRVFKHYDVPAYFKPSNSIKQLLVRPKDKILKEWAVGPVYHIPCDTCESSYIGETGGSQPSLNKDRGRHNLPTILNNVLKSRAQGPGPGTLDKSNLPPVNS